VVDHSVLRRFIISPNGHGAILWDLFGVAFLFYDLIVLPLHAFPIEDQNIIRVMHFVTTVIWSLDMVMSFLRGREVDGMVEMRPRPLAALYMRTWFLPDFTVVFWDWMSILGVYWHFTMVRSLRFLRLFRIFKIMWRFSFTRFELTHPRNSENRRALMVVMWLLWGLTLINHWVACGWFVIGNLDAYQRRWIEAPFEGADATLLYKYITCFHWSITQFTPASMEIFPTNAMERVYTIVIIMLGLLAFSTLISTITATMNRLSQITIAGRGQEHLCRRFIAERRLSVDLGVRILSYVKRGRLVLKPRLLESEIVALKTMPGNTLRQLHEEIFEPVLAVHPLFRQLLQQNRMVFSAICDQAITESAMQMGEEIFRPGMKGHSMYFITAGQLNYEFSHRPHTSLPVGSPEWLCEIVLWSSWEHRGRLSVVSHAAETIILHAESFHSVVLHSASRAVLRYYARLYAKRVLIEFTDMTQLNDVWGGDPLAKEITEIVFRTDPEEVGHWGKIDILLWQKQAIMRQRVFVAWKGHHRAQMKHPLRYILRLPLSKTVSRVVDQRPKVGRGSSTELTPRSCQTTPRSAAVL